MFQAFGAATSKTLSEETSLVLGLIWLLLKSVYITAIVNEAIGLANDCLISLHVLHGNYWNLEAHFHMVVGLCAH